MVQQYVYIMTFMNIDTHRISILYYLAASGVELTRREINYKSNVNHEDLNNPHHSNNRESVMYWAVEDISVANILRGGPPYEFDSDDQHDIEKIRQGEY